MEEDWLGSINELLDNVGINGIRWNDNDGGDGQESKVDGNSLDAFKRVADPPKQHVTSAEKHSQDTPQLRFHLFPLLFRVT